MKAPEDASPKRFIFHIGYVEGIARGFRVNYLGESFIILGVSDSTRLRGLELRCAPGGEQHPSGLAWRGRHHDGPRQPADDPHHQHETHPGVAQHDVGHPGDPLLRHALGELRPAQQRAEITGTG